MTILKKTQLYCQHYLQDTSRGTCRVRRTIVIRRCLLKEADQVEEKTAEMAPLQTNSPGKKILRKGIMLTKMMMVSLGLLFLLGITGNRPHLKVLGPALPPGFRRPADDDEEDESDGEDSQGFPGPALPPGYAAEASSSEEEEDDDVIGPMPFRGEVQNTVASDFERRAQRMKEKLTSGDDGKKELTRETWMTELPPELQHIGLGARTFKKRSGPENKDRSIWTDTPADRERKARVRFGPVIPLPRFFAAQREKQADLNPSEHLEGKLSGESQKEETPQISHKDLQMAEKVSKYNESKRGESLLSMHSKKIKKKAEAEANKPAERRPFDRDTDLQVNRFDEAQKKSLLKKSQELNTRFSHSKDRMFL
ncbi:hypothetical protein JZ751_027972 [Albula glossodonta]|uniref:GPALPP motifs-containing protein 1 n=1 Tax=Albula glossodonta TaxID=121402 RepID=A0A8T2PKN1_9TELE|nr:hypothetical protein JZ751_027972 [Albula glossodonta]